VKGAGAGFAQPLDGDRAALEDRDRIRARARTMNRDQIRGQLVFRLGSLAPHPDSARCGGQHGFGVHGLIVRDLAPARELEDDRRQSAVAAS
jgi:hypothetical protein